MTELLLRLFVKNYQDTGNPAVHSAVGILAGVTGIVCNCLLFLGKLIVGLLVGAVSIVADAVNNLSDAASSVVTLLSVQPVTPSSSIRISFVSRSYPYNFNAYPSLDQSSVQLGDDAAGVAVASAAQ